MSIFCGVRNLHRSLRRQTIEFGLTSHSVDVPSASFFLSRRSLRPRKKSEMPHWQDILFIRLMHSAQDATTYFRIPTDRVVEIGTQVAV